MRYMVDSSASTQFHITGKGRNGRIGSIRLFQNGEVYAEAYFKFPDYETFFLSWEEHTEYELETENLDMVREAVDAGADIIMLDNMSPEDMREAVRIIGGRAETECSGNVTKEKIEQLTGIGVDYISCGALTHSAPILDLSVKNLHLVEHS